MAKSARPIPDHYHAVMPYLTVHGAAQLIAFLTQVFDGQQTERVARPDGTIVHADVRIGDAAVMLADATGAFGAMPGASYVYVDDTDATYRRALGAGATSLLAPTDTFYGDRNAGVQDPFGNRWWIATHVEDVPPEDLQRRADASVRS